MFWWLLVTVSIYLVGTNISAENRRMISIRYRILEADASFTILIESKRRIGCDLDATLVP